MSESVIRFANESGIHKLSSLSILCYEGGTESSCEHSFFSVFFKHNFVSKSCFEQNSSTLTQTRMNPQPPSQFPNPLQSLFTGCQWSEPEAKVNHLQVPSAWLIAYIVFHLGVIEAQEWIQPARWSFITEVTLPAWRGSRASRASIFWFVRCSEVPFPRVLVG